eukprot:1158387-Pelagomonas_calceolata.AAC.5
MSHSKWAILTALTGGVNEADIEEAIRQDTEKADRHEVQPQKGQAPWEALVTLLNVPILGMPWQVVWEEEASRRAAEEKASWETAFTFSAFCFGNALTGGVDEDASRRAAEEQAPRKLFSLS